MSKRSELSPSWDSQHQASSIRKMRIYKSATCENAFLCRLEKLAAFTDVDRHRIKAISSEAEQIGSSRFVMGSNGAQGGAILLTEGFAVRWTSHIGGGRQITDFIVPGDIVWNDTALHAGHAHLQELAPSKFVHLSTAMLTELASRPNVERAFRSIAAIREATLRAWLLNMGRKSAEEKLAHTFCELHHRLSDVGRASDSRFTLPFTQFDLGDTLGLSYVHVNRMLKHLRERHLVSFRSKTVEIIDLPGLQTFCGFNPHYLLGENEGPTRNF